jgi:hypothetical protein
MTPTPPALKKGEKILYPIFHDESCFHANDQCQFVWIKDGEQPLRNKSRGRIVHVSDFIIEHSESGRLKLSPEQVEAQMKLPVRPAPSNPSAPSSSEPPNTDEASMDPSKKSKKAAKPKKPKNTRQAPATGRTAAEHVRDQTLPQDGASAYRLSSFDARRIIYPGANHDPWWDMPQLIAQVSTCLAH